LDEDKFGFDFIGEYRLPLKTLIKNETNHFNILLEEKQEVIVDFFLRIYNQLIYINRELYYI
jgi:hypothetical protein